MLNLNCTWNPVFVVDDLVILIPGDGEMKVKNVNSVDSNQVQQTSL